MDIEELKRNWDLFGRTDPLWSICTEPGKEKNRWDLEEFFKTGEEEIASVVAHLCSLGITLRGERALDFGCGVGRLTLPLCEFFDEVTGVDIAESMIALANEFNRCPGRCRYVLNERPDLGVFADGCFDFVYSSITLQHMEPQDAGAYLREFVRVLGPGGLLVFQVPDRADLHYLSNRIRKAAPAFALKAFRRLRYGSGRPRMEMHEMPREEVARLLDECGAELLDASRDEGARKYVSYRYFARRQPVP